MSKLKGGSPVVRGALASSHRKHCRRLAIRASLLTAGEEHDEVSEAEEQERCAPNCAERGTAWLGRLAARLGSRNRSAFT
jgi:hypothetical protein